MTTTTEPVTTTTLDEATQARAAYFYIASVANSAQDLVTSAFPRTGIAWKNYPSYCAQLAPINEKFAADLTAFTWPATAQDEIATQAGVAAEVAGLYYECSHDKGTGSALIGVSGRIDNANARAAAAASATRVALGLPVDRG